MLSGCGQEEAERKRDRAAADRRPAVFEARPGRRIPLGVSVGAAIFPHDGDTYEALLATADSRMYRDKTRRKQQPRVQVARARHDRPRDGVATAPVIEPTEVEIQRAGRC